MSRKKNTWRDSWFGAGGKKSMALKQNFISEKEEKREQKRFEKIERMIEKKEAKSLGRAVKRFGEGKENWL